jgi:hypothetical protein
LNSKRKEVNKMPATWRRTATVKQTTARILKAKDADKADEAAKAEAARAEKEAKAAAAKAEKEAKAAAAKAEKEAKAAAKAKKS